MNLWVLFLCRFLVHSKVKKRKIMIGCLMATLGETLVLCMPIGNSTAKILLGFGGITAMLIYLVFYPKTWEYFFRLLIFSYLTAAILGESLILMELLVFHGQLPLVSGLMGMVLTTIVVIKIYPKIENKDVLGEVELFLSDNSKCKIMALIDSGNSLVEPISQKPVSIVEKSVLEEFQQELLKENFRMVPFHSVGKEKGILEAYFIEKLEIRRGGECIVIEKPMIAVTPEKVSSKKDYQMILHPALLEN